MTRDDVLSEIERIAVGLLTTDELLSVMFVLDIARELGSDCVSRADVRATLSCATVQQLVDEIERRSTGDA